jgi:hypothetical protein
MGAPRSPIPDEFAEMIAALLEPGEAAAAADVLERALELDDEQLAQFMAGASALVRSSPRPLTAADLSELLASQA